MRLLWLSLMLSLAERLYPVVREEDGKKIVARWCFQPHFWPFAFLVFCDFLLRLHCVALVFGGFITPFFPVSTIHFVPV